MKNRFTAIIVLSLFFIKIYAQGDTLHIYYKGVKTKMGNSNKAMIRKWTDSLKGKKTDIQVLAYYSDEKFKQRAQKRADELSQLLKGNTPGMINITSISLVKSIKSQHSKIDVIYAPSLIIEQSGARGG